MSTVADCHSERGAEVLPFRCPLLTRLECIGVYSLLSHYNVIPVIFHIYIYPALAQFWQRCYGKWQIENIGTCVGTSYLILPGIDRIWEFRVASFVALFLGIVEVTEMGTMVCPSVPSVLWSLDGASFPNASAHNATLDVPKVCAVGDRKLIQTGREVYVEVCTSHL